MRAGFALLGCVDKGAGRIDNRRMRSFPVLAVGLLVLLVSGCDLLKRKADDKSGSGATTSSTSGSSGSGSSGSGSTQTTAAETNDPSKGATAGCTWPDSDVHKDITFTKGCQLTAKSNITVFDGATITFEEGVKISFDADTWIWVDYGKFVVKGTDSAPVVFTSANKSPAPGDWVGIGFREKTMAGSSIDHLIVEYAGSKSRSGEGAIRLESMRQGGRLSLTNSTIRNSAQFGLVTDDNGTFGKFENNTFKDNKSGSLHVVAEMLGSVGRGNTFTNPIHVRQSHVDETTTWPPFDVPVVVDENIEIHSDSSVPTLTIADKTVVKMAQNTRITIDGGALVAKNVTFTSAAPSPSAGDWSSIFIHKKSNGTDIENCTFEYFGNTDGGGQGAITLWGASAKDLTGVKIANNTFRKGKQSAMKSDDNDCKPFASNNKADGVPFCHPAN